MESHVQKWGNSLGVRIPLHLAKKLHLSPGSAISIEIENEKLVIQTLHYDLDTMLNAITPENKHNLLLDDKPLGNEEW